MAKLLCSRTSLVSSSSLVSVTACATSVGNYALFAGGVYEDQSSNVKSKIVTAYDKSLTQSTPTALCANKTYPCATSVGGFAIISGDYYSSYADIYDESLTRTTAKLSISRHLAAATSVGNYALIGGGLNSGVLVDTVEAFVVT